MQVIIHDLDDDTFGSLQFTGKPVVINANDKAAPCQGCFKCWLKNAGYCFISDNLQHVGGIIGSSDTITIISKLTYGCYSSSVKRVLDRGISNSLPFFTYRNWETHHVKRYKHKDKQIMNVYLYGPSSELERHTAQELVEMNRINLGIDEANLVFLSDKDELKGCSI